MSGASQRHALRGSVRDGGRRAADTCPLRAGHRPETRRRAPPRVAWPPGRQNNSDSHAAPTLCVWIGRVSRLQANPMDIVRR
jgi:hypothetical protein